MEYLSSCKLGEHQDCRLYTIAYANRCTMTIGGGQRIAAALALGCRDHKLVTEEENVTTRWRLVRFGDAKRFVPINSAES